MSRINITNSRSLNVLMANSEKLNSERSEREVFLSLTQIAVDTLNEPPNGIKQKTSRNIKKLA